MQIQIIFLNFHSILTKSEQQDKAFIYNWATFDLKTWNLATKL